MLKYLDDLGLSVVVQKIKGVENVIAADYDATSTYAVGDYCVHGGKLYRCSTAISTAEAWDSTHWTEITVMGALSAITPGTKLYLHSVTFSTYCSSATIITPSVDENGIVTYTKADYTPGQYASKSMVVISTNPEPFTSVANVFAYNHLNIVLQLSISTNSYYYPLVALANDGYGHGYVLAECKTYTGTTAGIPKKTIFVIDMGISEDTVTTL